MPTTFEPDVGDWHIPAVATPAKDGRSRLESGVLSRSLAARARSRIAELDQEIERLQRSEEATVVATVRHASADAQHGSCWVSKQ